MDRYSWFSVLHVVDWTTLQEKNAKKLDVWKGGSMSIAGRTTPINSTLSSTYIYHMSMYLLPKTVTNILDKQRRTFFWQGGGQKRKYHLVKWETICKNKKKGGLGIKDIKKWILAYYASGGGSWTLNLEFGRTLLKPNTSKQLQSVLWNTKLIIHRFGKTS